MLKIEELQISFSGSQQASNRNFCLLWAMKIIF